ncbi:type IV secretion system DNA-binding domain-containing protein [Alteriqipengyuania sp. NZ-12B]|uniref:Type IV secretion system DNA-binding domain-containing protein n=1 Tax=Alteriqipengyuania abyssalis TaxID=2860200 RepID=A0ABS7PBF8_9SPHN|nr:type IV secretion system DNA-binding domain-containing protein [Alteriqipengyuania abyssalis]MBY8335575.1 type IV secretion system DNA-binding domain-containing protein [Alteriqipengyuania abyssalis]
MKHNLVNFTRGSQLLGHFGFMFAAGLKGPLIVTVLVALGLVYWEVSGALDDHQIYLLWMHVYASAYGFMEFDPDKLVNLKLADGSMVAFPISVVTDYPPMREAVALFRSTAVGALWLAALILAPLFLLFWWVAERFGERSKQKKHVRGAELATLPELKREIERHNRDARSREYGETMGWKWRLAGSSYLRDAGFYAPAHLARVSWPWRLEQSHAMLVGTTGTGKTVVLTELADEIRQRGERAVIFDLTGAFIETFYEPERDIILNPLDARCPAWSVFNDCTTRAEFHAAAESLVPHDGGGAEQFWVLAARTLFVETCLKLAEAGRGTNAALAHELMNADLSDLHQLLEDTMAGPISTPSAARMAESVRAVFNVNAKALQMLPEDGVPFSVREWVNGAGKPGSILFLSARYIDMSVLSQLLTLWLDTSINTLMAGERSRDLRLWFLIDELGALHRLPSLEKGLQTARNFGGAIVTGIHAFAKLKDVYGENMAKTLSSLARTKLILGTADRETATWCSDVIGHREVREMEEGYSYGYNNARDAVSLTPRRQVVPLLLPDELMKLKNLHGFIKFPEGFPAAPVVLQPRNWPRVAEGFIAREIPKTTKKTASAGGEAGTTTQPTGASETSDNDGDPRRMKDKHDPSNRPAKRPRKDQQKDPNRGRRTTKVEQARPEQTKVRNPRVRAQRDALPAQSRPAQSELLLASKTDEDRDREQETVQARRSDIPDPATHQRAQDARGKADQKMQEEQQKSLLGGAAKQGRSADEGQDHDHDLGDYDPDM